MILSSLHSYYQRLLEHPDEDSGQPKIPPYGFTDEKIGYILIIDKSGNLIEVSSNLTDNKKGRRVRVPCSFGRSGKFTEKAFSEGKNIAFFLWDKPEFLLGVKYKNKTLEICDLPFRAFKKHHQDLIKTSRDKGLCAVLSFLEKWNPLELEKDSRFTAEMLKFNFSFKLDGDWEHPFIFQREAAQTVWKNYWGVPRSPIYRQCLVTGVTSPCAETHPAIKIHGGQTSGVAIVTYNEEAYESYGNKQGSNAPVSEKVAFSYSSLLNYLLRVENDHCLYYNKINKNTKIEERRPLLLGNTCVVFWAVAKTKKQEKFSEEMLHMTVSGMEPNDESQKHKISLILEKIAKGYPLKEAAPDIDENTRFFVLGLAPNASRLSIRFWLDTNMGELGKNITQHWQALQLEPLAWKPEKPPSMWRLLIELTPKRKKADGTGEKRKTEDIPSRLAGAFFRSIITGTQYPVALLTKIIQRIRSDGDISSLRSAMIKAVLYRNFKRSVSMGLNESEQNIAYQLGCCFALFEKAQRAVIGEVNAGVKDKFFGAASATPKTVFPSLHRNFNHHISDLRKGKKAKPPEMDQLDPKKLAGWLEKRTGEILRFVDSSTGFPAHLSLTDQGMFILGYYHQRFSKSKNSPANPSKTDDADDTDSETSQGE